jgi:hypothetical protein
LGQLGVSLPRFLLGLPRKRQLLSHVRRVSHCVRAGKEGNLRRSPWSMREILKLTSCHSEELFLFHLVEFDGAANGVAVQLPNWP